MGNDAGKSSERASESTNKSKSPSGAKNRTELPQSDSKTKGGSKTEAGQARGSRSYSSNDLKDDGKTNWRTARKGHTASAERSARHEVKAATGRDAKVAGGKVEHHHHAGVKESKAVGLNPRIAGEKARMTAIHSRRDPKTYGTYGDKADATKNKRLTQHNTVSRMDKYEQGRAAKALGAKGDSPKLPKTDAGRRALVDASATSKWRLPASTDQTARAKAGSERKAPAGPRVDKSGRVASDRGSGPKAGREAAKAGQPPDISKRTPKGEGIWAELSKELGTKKGRPPVAAGKGAEGSASRTTGSKATTPKPEMPATLPKPKVPGGDIPVPAKGGGPGRWGRAIEGAGRARGVAGVLGSAGEIIDVIAREKPSMLPEGARVPLYRDHPTLPAKVPTGFTVEKSGGKVIYRAPNGAEVSKDKAEAASKPNYGGEA